MPNTQGLYKLFFENSRKIKQLRDTESSLSAFIFEAVFVTGASAVSDRDREHSGY